ncbi:MAG: HD domain-containing protein [Syntrophomonadaceae bacterium]|nr:HD domain-containing protein [Syntrophomonadaceae bacterium]
MINSGTELIKILIIEDDEAHSELIARSFEDHQTTFNLIFKTNLKESRQYLEENQPQIVLCDWMLPDGKGLDIFPQDPKQIPFPIVVMTSYGNEELAVETIKAGAFDYIVKSADTLANMAFFVLRVLREWNHIAARKEAEKRLQNVLWQTVESLALMVEKRDPYTSGHQRKVSELSTAIARKMNLSEETVQGIRIAGILHDIGKLMVPLEYLNKPGKLAPLEFSIIKTHPQHAYDMLKTIDFPFPVDQVVLQHHEKYDGSGYPQGLRGDEILLEARIITVADVVEAISSHRPYRPALGIRAALEEISTYSGSSYDPNVVKACLELFQTGEFHF